MFWSTLFPDRSLTPVGHVVIALPGWQKAFKEQLCRAATALAQRTPPHGLRSCRHTIYSTPTVYSLFTCFWNTAPPSLAHTTPYMQLDARHVSLFAPYFSAVFLHHLLLHLPSLAVCPCVTPIHCPVYFQPRFSTPPKAEQTLCSAGSSFTPPARSAFALWVCNSHCSTIIVSFVPYLLPSYTWCVSLVVVSLHCRVHFFGGRCFPPVRAHYHGLSSC